ncbi:MAG: nucleotidyltransferase domain-containing protein [Clostridia bacterium]|nr:MAG: nucleotidyltransferase domain-containing protein [Clostridia bacterium]
MLLREVIEVISRYVREIEVQGIEVEKVLLFGSRARGDSRPESDIDLLVISRDFAAMPTWRRWEILGRAASRIMAPVEARGHSPEEIDLAKLPKVSFLREILTRPETMEVDYH